MLFLASAGSALVFDHTRLDSPTMDEPFHTLAAAEYAIAGTYYANLEHPPLVKLLAGFAIRAAGGRAPQMDVPFSMATAEQPRPSAFNSPLRPETLFAVARAPVSALFFLLVVVTGWAVRSWAGDLAGILAAALVAFEPNLLAHAGVVHTDLAAALGFFGDARPRRCAPSRRRSLGLWAADGRGARREPRREVLVRPPRPDGRAPRARPGLFRERRAAAREGRRPISSSLATAFSSRARSRLAVLFGSYASRCGT